MKRKHEYIEVEEGFKPGLKYKLCLHRSHQPFHADLNICQFRGNTRNSAMF